MDLRFEHPCTALVVGASGCGKTFWIKKVIEHRSALFSETLDQIIFYYSEWQSVYQELADQHHVQFRQELPYLDDHPAGQGSKLIIIDDFLDELKAHSKEILKFYIKGSHHRNMSVFFLSQSLFPEGLRTISLNSHYIILFKTSRDRAQIRAFTMQVDPKHWRGLLEAYQDATQLGHTYILFDFKPNQEEHLRIRSKIFPDESCVVYVPREKV